MILQVIKYIDRLIRDLFNKQITLYKCKSKGIYYYIAISSQYLKY